MAKIFMVLLALLPVFTIAQAQTKSDGQVAAAVEQLRKLMVDPDKAALEKITDPALSYGHSSGKIQDQPAFIDALVTGASDFLTIELTEQTITVEGNTAIVRHTLNATTNDGGKPGTVKIAVLLVWIKKAGAWKLLARQAVKLPV